VHEQRRRIPGGDVGHGAVHALRDHDSDAAELNPGRERGEEVPARGRADADEREARELRVLLRGPPLDDGLDGGELAAILPVPAAAAGGGVVVVEGPALGAAGDGEDGVPAAERFASEAALLGEPRAARAARGGVEEVGGADGAPGRREQRGPQRRRRPRQLPQHLVAVPSRDARVEADGVGVGVGGGGGGGVSGQQRRRGRRGAREEQRGGEEEQGARRGDQHRGPERLRDPGEDWMHFAC